MGFIDSVIHKFRNRGGAQGARAPLPPPKVCWQKEMSSGSKWDTKINLMYVSKLHASPGFFDENWCPYNQLNILTPM